MSSGSVQFTFEMKDYLNVRINFYKIDLKQEGMDSSIGYINPDHINQLLEILSKLVYTIANSIFGQGYQVPLTNEFYWTLESVVVSHKNGYLLILASFNFEKIDIFALVQMYLQSKQLSMSKVIESFIK